MRLLDHDHKVVRLDIRVGTHNSGAHDIRALCHEPGSASVHHDGAFLRFYYERAFHGQKRLIAYCKDEGLAIDQYDVVEIGFDEFEPLLLKSRINIRRTEYFF